jgi:protein-tyrosine kinase
MSIIEQAARRLDELKRAGVEVPWKAPGLSSADAGVAAPLRPVDAARVADSRGRRSDQPSDLGRRSRSVEIDLVRLERDGYLVPHLAHSALGTELRITPGPNSPGRRSDAAT